MKSPTRIVALLSVFGAFSLAAVGAGQNSQPSCPGCGGAALAPIATADAAAIVAYPLTTCVVSGDKLGGDMGAPFDYIYKEDGKPDRLVRFCCKGCLKDFKKDPAKYLKMIDDAAVAKTKVAPVAPQH